MPYCHECNSRYFSSYSHLQQHLDNSDAHRPGGYDWECEICDNSFKTEQARRQHYINGSHDYCSDCDRLFQNHNNLTQHMRSRAHQGTNITCPWCKTSYVTASGLTIHLESGNCSSGLDRHKINRQVQQLDRNNVITKPMITYPGYENSQTIATSRSWNGRAYECPLSCNREFNTLHGLNNHLKSPFHEQNIYRCPGRGCGREYKVLSGLVQHVESESCGVMRFSAVQHNARIGAQGMIGRMIQGM
ncbi:hypothetical protein HYFRA_00003818 [Hymenoscyphus fraxineus]|uniref:C2H2-type domain-containing protein n=1 Tax=Hymenoscyphus fraxineus TaxID=746836 RepID=A0A9N9PJZ5_9HELO|nr:hypothetical protein HYFRA_00003818 [Hymenoscyphus fraxineus]